MTDINNNNIDEFCECNNLECSRNHAIYSNCENKNNTNSFNNSNVDSDTYDEIIDYDTEENLIDSLQAQVNEADFFSQDEQITKKVLNQLAETESNLEIVYARWQELDD